MYRSQNLRIPGPTFVPQSVLQASARPLINHRGPEFSALLAGLTRALQDFLRTQNDVLLLSCSGSGGMEAAIANTLARGDRVLVFSNGAFGERFHQIARLYGVDARRVDVTWGRAVEPDLVRDEIAKEKGKDAAKAILITHNETSTGVLNPLKEIAEVVRESGKLFIVDSISGAGAVETEVDEWGIDVLVRAQTPATPAVTVFIALQESLKLMAEEGVESICERHRDLAFATRRAVQALGLGLFADEAYASPTVTSFRSPTRVDARNLIRILRESYDTVIGGGQGRLEGQIARVGHMGFVTLQDMVTFVSALELTMRDLHQPVEPGQGVTALLKAYDEATQPPPKAKAAAVRTATLARR
jgi:aspartate aminotransferase-like enzyme